MDFSFLNESIGKTVQCERGGPEKLSGKLVAIGPDYIGLYTENDGVVYVCARHMKALSEPVVPEINVAATANGDANAQQGEEAQPVIVDAENFLDLCSKLTHRMVRINHAGPNSVQGVMMYASDDFVTVLHQMKEYVHFPVDQIRSITWLLNTNNAREREKQQEGNGDKGKK